jgi:hypothetical protein
LLDPSFHGKKQQQMKITMYPIVLLANFVAQIMLEIQRKNPHSAPASCRTAPREVDLLDVERWEDGPMPLENAGKMMGSWKHGIEMAGKLVETCDRICGEPSCQKFPSIPWFRVCKPISSKCI